MKTSLSFFGMLSLALLSACSGGSGGDDSSSATPFDPGPFVSQTGTTAASLGLLPFDVNQQDLSGPTSWEPQYGKLPEIVVSPRTGGLDVALQSYTDPANTKTMVLRFSDGGGNTFTLTQAFQAPALGLLMGFASDPSGGFYYATGSKDSDVSATYPAVGVYRSNVVRVYRADSQGQILFNIDLDLARYQFRNDAEPLIHPGVASSARLALAGGQLALVHGINTEYDPGVQARHQKAISTYLDATTGHITAVSGIWCSHSFDQRYVPDGNDLYEIHLGDAYPRQVVVSRVRGGQAGNAFGLCSLKGALGQNNTYTRLGNMARIDAGSGSGGYLVLFSMEHGDVTTHFVNGSRDLALVRTVSDFASGQPANAIDGAFGSTFTVTSCGVQATNRLLWLTSYNADSGGTQHAERPKLIALGGGEFLVLWERWTTSGSSMAYGGSQTFDGTFAMRINGAGTTLAAATHVSNSHLPRGDDAFLYNGNACFVTGDAATGKLTLHCISPSLVASEVALLP